MNVIFLDFNGVLDTWENMNEVNQDNLNRLKRIVDETGSKVVITSSVKTSYFFVGMFNTVFKYLAKTLTDAGIEIVGITPLARGKANEIKIYLDAHPEVKNFCILDDEGEMEPFKENFVKLPIQSEENPSGLTDEHVDQALAILNRNIEYTINPVLKKTQNLKGSE